MRANKNMKSVVEWISPKQDERGSVWEPLSAERLQDQRNVHIVMTDPGKIRGNHFHREGVETIVVYGPALVRIREVESIADIVIPDGRLLRLVIPPGVSHAIKNTGVRPNLLVAFNTTRHDPQVPDTVRDILLRD